MPGPRFVDVAFKKDPKPRYLTNHPPPANLGACHESRHEALKRFTLKLGANRVESSFWIDPVNDTVNFCLFPRPDGLRHLWDYRQQTPWLIGEEAKATLQHVATDAYFYQYGQFNCFKAIQSFTMVLPPDYEKDGGFFSQWRLRRESQLSNNWRLRSSETGFHPPPEAYLQEPRQLPQTLLRVHLDFMKYNSDSRLPKPEFLVIDEEGSGGGVVGRA
jgi:hypothetical protein